MAVQLQSTRTYPVGVERSFDLVMPASLPRLFARWYAAVPPIREVRDQRGAWGSVGQTRTICFAAGSTMRETLTSVDRPRSFAYRLGDLTGPLRLLIAEAAGEWRFEPAGDGTRITWTWTVHPRGALGRAAMPAVGAMWRGYARRGLEEIERLLVG